MRYIHFWLLGSRARCWAPRGRLFVGSGIHCRVFGGGGCATTHTLRVSWACDGCGKWLAVVVGWGRWAGIHMCPSPMSPGGCYWLVPMPMSTLHERLVSSLCLAGTRNELHSLPILGTQRENPTIHAHCISAQRKRTHGLTCATLNNKQLATQPYQKYKLASPFC